MAELSSAELAIVEDELTRTATRHTAKKKLDSAYALKVAIPSTLLFGSLAWIAIVQIVLGHWLPWYAYPCFAMATPTQYPRILFGVFALNCVGLFHWPLIIR